MTCRVVITGLGVLSGAGANVTEVQRNIAAGVCCLSPITDPRAAHFKSHYAGLLTGAAAALEPPLELAGFDRHVHMAWVAAREALASAVARPTEWGRRLGLVFATCSGPMLLIEAHYERILRGDLRLTEREWLARQYHTGARVLARELGVRGLSTTVVTACSASTAAMALAADLIRCGILDAALAGGADAFSTSTLAGFEGLKATNEGKCAPFSKPFGLNLGEAAAFVFLESLASARKRQVPIHAELLGSGMSNDAFHCSAPEPAGRGLAAAMERALGDAKLLPEHISYINAHGTGTEANDKAETKAVRKIFGPRAEHTPVSSTKSIVGHCLGAAGAVEAIASIVCAKAGVLPPTANFTEPREGCALDCVPEVGRTWPAPQVFLSNNSAFGGHNASLVLSLAHADGVADSAPASDERVFITACGVISALGIGTGTLVEGADRGHPKPRLVSVPGLPPLLAGMVDEKGVEAFDRRLDLRHLDRSSRWATVAARLAIREARYSERPSSLAELGLFLSLSDGPSWAESEYLTSFLSNHRQVTQVTAFPHIVPGSVAGNVCRALRLAGHNLTLSAGAGAGLLGLESAIAALRTGHAKAILSGAVDELSDRILTDRFMAGRFAADSAEFPGEGAAVLMLESAHRVLAGDVLPLACICGAASSTASEGLPGLVQTVRETLAQTGIEAGQVTAVCADLAEDQFQELAGTLCPAWAGLRVGVAPGTGRLDGAQILVDLAVALLAPPGHSDLREYVLALAGSPHGMNCAVVCKKIEKPAQGR